MATYRQVIEGLKILAKYEPKGEDDLIAGAGHDVIWGGGPYDPNSVSPDDRAALEKLGWHIDSESECWSRYV